MELTPEMIEYIISSNFRRSEAIKLAGGISAMEVDQGKPIPEGWVLDDVLDFYVPPDFHFSNETH